MEPPSSLKEELKKNPSVGCRKSSGFFVYNVDDVHVSMALFDLFGFVVLFNRQSIHDFSSVILPLSLKVFSPRR